MKYKTNSCIKTRDRTLTLGQAPRMRSMKPYTDTTIIFKNVVEIWKQNLGNIFLF